MALKPGYKMTELGIIPEDWSVENLGQRVTFRTGPFGTALHKSDYTENGTPIVNPMHIINGHIVPSMTMTVTKEAANSLSEYKLKLGDVVIGRRGDMGRCAEVKTNEVGWLCGTGSLIIRCSDSVLPNFLQLVLSGARAIAAIENASVGSTMVNLNQGVLHGLKIQFPPLPEQRAIAAALSDTAALLSSLDRLLAKKRDIKQAVMQQLLTGKQRLSGFRGEWEAKRLGELFDITTGSSKTKYIKKGGRYLIVDMGSVSVQGKLIASKPTDYSGDFLKRGDLVMPKDDIGGGNIIGKAAYIDEDDRYILSDHIYALKIRPGNSLFLSHVINGNATNSALRKKVSGSAQLGLGRKSVEEQLVPFPELAEQTAIAAVLSDMDAEIDALQERRDKTRAVKQGMMQELLTGRTRLV